MTDTVHIVIPSRYASSRLPGKPLKLIAGKPMIERVYEQAKKTGIASICIATEDSRIKDAADAFGAETVMTRDDHPSGTERLAEVCGIKGWGDNDIVINLQGDEPLMPPEVIRFIASLAGETAAEITTLATPITRMEDIFNANIVKVVLDANGKAHYFSRAPIPWDRDNYQWGGEMETSPSPRYRHLGMYAYRVSTLKKIPQLPACEAEQIESLEQLRPLYHGIDIQVGIIDKAPDHGIDTAEDLLRVNEIFNTSGE